MNQKYRYGGDKVSQDTNKKNKPRGGWGEDEGDYKVKNTSGTYGSYSYNNNNHKDYSKSESYTNYKPPENQTAKAVVVPLEQKLIEDLIQPIGISVKPNETQLKELSRRSKSLDREIIYKFLFEKLSNYENMSDQTNSKILLKCLYVVEHLLHSKIDDITQGFSENQDLFENIRATHSSNKKICDVVNSILSIFNPNISTKSHTTNMNLLGEESIQGKNNNVNLLDNLSKNNNTNPNFIDILSQENTKKSNLIDNNIFSNITTCDNSTSQNKSFKFIKSKSNFPITNDTNNQPTNEMNNAIMDLTNLNISKNSHQTESPKKTFSFIKSKDKINNNNAPNINQDKNGLEDIFGNSFSPQTQQSNYISNFNNIPTVDLTKSSNTDMDEIFRKRNSHDINQITSQYNQNYSNTSGVTKNYDNSKLDLIMGTTFNYDHVNVHIETNKINEPKDHFSFVNDMLKSKKN